MARRKNQTLVAPGLFADQEKHLERRLRRQRALFIPRLLQEAAANLMLKTAAQDRAFEIAVRWADLETNGHLPLYKETAIDTQFLDQLFGEGLGYRVKTTSPDEWQLEHKIPVKGVGIADAALGEFPKAAVPSAIIELKGAMTDLDRDRSNGRTAVQQGWDYRNALPDCLWVIVSNFKTIRLYHREKGTLSYEEFALQELRRRERFDEFYCLFERGGLLSSRIGQQPRALALLRKTVERQKVVGDELYKKYQLGRLELIEHLHREEGKDLDEAIRIAQKLLDRIIFIAFCEDRDLLPENTLKTTRDEIRTYSRAKNPAWEAFLDLFTAMDKGAKGKREITAFNGGLFADDEAINSLQLESEKWTNAFVGFGSFDFSEEVNVEVLGHIFERSITELEKLRVGGLFAMKASAEEAKTSANGVPMVGTGKKKKTAKPAADEDDSTLSKMPKSAQRKRFGIYYTPPAFTGLIVERTIDALVWERFQALAKKHKVDPEVRKNQNPEKWLAYWTACLGELKSITVCDPACGSGAFLIRAYESLDGFYKTVVHALAGAGLSPAEVAKLEDSIPDFILNRNLYGVDLSHEAVEITQLALWIRSARLDKTLADLSHNIVRGNSLVSEPSVDPLALDWQATFPAIFGEDGPGGFSCVIGNPPWERVKLEEREFFGFSAPTIATSSSAVQRKKLIAELESKNPELWKNYRRAQASATRTLDYVRCKKANFPLTGKGDVNLYMLFAELAGRIVSPNGKVGLLLPSGIATDHTTKEFFGRLVADKTLVAVYDFVNRFGLFPDVEGRLKFCVLLFTGEQTHSDEMDFVFWAERIEHIAEKSRHVVLTERDIKLINPNTRTCPIFRSQRDAELTKHIYSRVPILIDRNRKQGGNQWGIRFFTMFHQTNDAKLFDEGKVWAKRGFRLIGNVYLKKSAKALPLFEAKMTRDYDHRASSVTMNTKKALMAYDAVPVSLVDHQNPEFLPQGRYWVSENDVAERAPRTLSVTAIGFHDIARANDSRTMVACLVPYAGFSNKIPLVVNEGELAWRRFSCLIAIFNSFVYDFIVRQKVGGANLNFFIVEQLATLSPDTFAEKCPWSKKEILEHWISERVLKLSCTANDMIPLAKACGFEGSEGGGVHKWRDADRMQLRAELDAAFAHLYGISEDDFAYMLSTFPSVPEPVIVATRNAYRDLAFEARI